MAGYRIFTDATADLSGALLEGLPPVTVIPMEVEVGGTVRVWGPGGDLSAADFYTLLRAGAHASTSRIRPEVYRRSFEPVLRQGQDVLYLCFSSGMSGTFETARLCAAELEAEYPGRRVLCIDTLCASVGEGFLVRQAACLQARGWPLEELACWAAVHRLEVCHWFTVDEFDHLRRGGRVSAAAAVFGTAMQIKPLLHVDEKGRLAVLEKPRGRRQAIQAQLARMEAGWTPRGDDLVLVGHGDCPERAMQLRRAVEERFPGVRVETVEIGPVIAAHTGPGMLALVHWGSAR